jgi:hypothetical protein
MTAIPVACISVLLVSNSQHAKRPVLIRKLP